MSRIRRPYSPGAVFHIASRTIRHVRWFDNPHVADGIVRIMRESLVRSDTQLLAWAIMPTHYHLIVRQNSAPLARFVGRVNQRIAYLVQRFYNHEGYVFERRFRHVECKDVDHLRNAIVYVHRNPVDADICNDPSVYRWSSHRSYFPTDSAHADLMLPEIIAPLRLFAAITDESYESLRAGYSAYASYLDACRNAPPGQAPNPPLLEAGDRFWTEEFVNRAARTLNNSQNSRSYLGDVARAVLHELTPGFTIEQMLLRRGGSTVTLLRHEIIRRAVRLGFRGVDIARFLHISTATVAQVAASEVGRPQLAGSNEGKAVPA